LRSALRAYPRAEAAQLRQKIHHLGTQAVRARDALKRNADAALVHLRGVGTQPCVIYCEHIIGDPNHVRVILFE
jgi:hypothetical protein